MYVYVIPPPPPLVHTHTHTHANKCFPPFSVFNLLVCACITVRIRVGARVGLKNKEERYKISNNSKDETLATKNKKKKAATLAANVRRVV